MMDSLGILANKEKIGALLAYISSKSPDIKLRKLIKLVFLIDRKSIELKGYPLTWLDYYVWEKGPVAPEIYYIKENGGLFSNYVTVAKKSDGKYTISPKENVQVQSGMQKFSNNQLKLIDSIIAEYGCLSADQLTDLTHIEEGIWNKAVKEEHIDFNRNPKTDVKLDLSSLIDKDSDNYQSYLDALENVQFAASLNYK